MQAYLPIISTKKNRVFIIATLRLFVRYPKFKLKTWICIALLSATIPVLINYFLKLDSIAYMTLE